MKFKKDFKDNNKEYSKYVMEQNIVGDYAADQTQ